MNKAKALEILSVLPDNVEIQISIYDMEEPTEPVDPEPEPILEGTLIEVKKSEAYKAESYQNDQGLWVMKNAGVGRDEIGDRFLVEVDFIMGDSGIRYWRIIKGPHTAEESDQYELKGLYLTKDYTKKVDP